MRRVFVIRKDLEMRPGKLAAMVGHMCEAYWTNLLKDADRADIGLVMGQKVTKRTVKIPYDIWDEYVNGIFTKTICECRNLAQLHKADDEIKALGLEEGRDWGYINDKCLTDLTPENQDGTTTVGMWFRPLPDDQAHRISKKFKLYGAFDI